MDKYRVVGVLNIIIGAIGSLFSLIFLLTVVTKLTPMYQSFGVSRVTLLTPYIMLFAMFLVDVFYLLIGHKLVSHKIGGKELHFKIGIALLILAVISVPLFVGFLVMSTILPIYSLEKSF